MDYLPLYFILATIVLVIAKALGLGISWLVVIAPIGLMLVCWFGAIALWGLVVAIGWLISKF